MAFGLVAQTRICGYKYLLLAAKKELCYFAYFASSLACLLGFIIKEARVEKIKTPADFFAADFIATLALLGHVEGPGAAELAVALEERITSSMSRRGSCGRKKTNAACPPSPRRGSRGRQQ